MLSDAFSAEKTYTAGDYAIYNNTLYRFTAAKPVGAWDASKAVAVTVAGELGKLSENIKNNTSSRLQATYMKNDYYKKTDDNSLSIIEYRVVNGICFARARISCVLPVSSWVTIATGMPGSLDEDVSTFIYIGYMGTTGEKIGLRINENGVVSAFAGAANQVYQGTFCYPCIDNQ